MRVGNAYAQEQGSPIARSGYVEARNRRRQHGTGIWPVTATPPSPDLGFDFPAMRSATTDTAIHAVEARFDLPASRQHCEVTQQPGVGGTRPGALPRSHAPNTQTGQVCASRIAPDRTSHAARRVRCRMPRGASSLTVASTQRRPGWLRSLTRRRSHDVDRLRVPARAWQTTEISVYKSQA